MLPHAAACAMRPLVLVLVLLVALALVACGAAENHAAKVKVNQNDQVALERARLAALFDFEQYKQTFGKSYTSETEQLDRKRLYLARALRTYAVATKYQHYQLSHYNAVNDLSDWSPKELERLTNRVLGELVSHQEGSNSLGSSGPEVGVAQTPEVPEFLAHENEDVEREVLEVLASNLSLPRGGKVRVLPLEKLINSGENDQKTADKQKKKLRNMQVKSNNPNYVQLEPAASFGLMDQQESVATVDLKYPAQDKRPVGEQLASFMTKTFGRNNNKDAKRGEDSRDIVYHDLRTTNCLSAPRSQGPCGSCYAFSTIAIMEFLYCIKSDQSLVEFSEQYMLDCGNKRFVHAPGKHVMNGCDGGDVDASVRFIHNFGLELRSQYPYSGHEAQCPYDESYDLKKTGFIRMELKRAVAVPSKHWAEFIKLSPMYIVVQLGEGDQFSEYGGGVDQCSYCKKRSGYHAMVLVGHGRESGHDYWLIRNSYGTRWGEQGYWKLSKKAAERFVYAREGVLFGAAEDGSSLEVEPRMSRAATGSSMAESTFKAAAQGDHEGARGGLAALLEQLAAAQNGQAPKWLAS